MSTHQQNKSGRDLTRRIAQSTRSLAQAFSSDERGVIAIIFALTATIVLAMVGGAVDYGRWHAANSRTLEAMDTAVLAAGRVLQINGATEAQAIATAEEYYNKNKSALLSQDDVTFSVVNGSEIVAESNSWVETPFLNAMGVQKLRVKNKSKAILAAGANSGSDIEISMMLDTTGSMSGSKMDDLKAAAKDLIDIVVWRDQSEYTSKVALAPFSQYVNVSRQYFEDFTGQAPSGTGDQRTCVKEREGNNRYKDKKPSSGNGYFGAYTGGGTCKPTSTIVPLTNDKDALKTAINAMPTTGWTAGHLGTAWAWYLLSPKFKSFFPSESKPQGYSKLTELNEDGQPKLYKIAILMTDGEYNTWYSGDDSATQARELCTAMKNKDITVYTIGFQIASGGTADTTMQLCATSSEHYYSADDGAALKSAFRDIALKISTLRLAE